MRREDKRGGKGRTDRVEDVELQCDGANDGSEEQPGDPDPRTDDGTFAIVLKVSDRKY